MENSLLTVNTVSFTQRDNFLPPPPNSRAKEASTLATFIASSQHHCLTVSPVAKPGSQARPNRTVSQDAPEVAGPFPTLPTSSDPFRAAPHSKCPFLAPCQTVRLFFPKQARSRGAGPPRGPAQAQAQMRSPGCRPLPGPPGDSRQGTGREVTGEPTPEPAPLARAEQDLPSYCKSTRTSKKGNTEPSRLVTEPGATMSEGAVVRKTRELGPPAPAGAQKAAVPARSQLSLRPKRQLAPTTGRRRWAGPGPRYAQAQPLSSRLLAGRSSPGLVRVVVRADRPRSPSPRPASDRVTWKHETRLRRARGGAVRHLQTAWGGGGGGEAAGSLGRDCLVRMRRCQPFWVGLHVLG